FGIHDKRPRGCRAILVVQVNSSTNSEGGFNLMKRIAAILTIVGATLGFAAPAMAAPSLCVTAHIDVNGTVQDVNQCLPA
ncbi:MAG: hypothetical protein QOJ03_3490, partial [Frankiaceae bacterium]|nr:hypothetical protein [Frankiaceae bacterium]